MEKEMLLADLDEKTISVSVETIDFYMIVDFPRKKEADGGVSASRFDVVVGELPNDTGYLTEMIQEVGRWVVINHSDKFF